MRYPATEKLEIIRLVEGSHLPARQTLDKLGVNGGVKTGHGAEQKSATAAPA